MSDDQDKKNPRFNLTPPPPPPPSIEEITRRAQVAGSSQARDASAPDALVEMLQQMKEALAQARQTIVAKDSEIAGFTSSFKDVQVQLTQVGNVLKTKDTEIEELRSRVQVYSAEMKNKDGEAGRWKAKYDLLEETISRSKQDALASQRKVEWVQKENAKLNEALVAVTAEKADLQRKLDEVTKQSQVKLDEVVKQSQVNLDELAKRSQADVEALHAENARIKDQIAMYEAQVKDQELKTFTLKEEMTTLKDKLVAETESKKALEMKLGASKMRVIIGSDAIIQIINELLDSALHSVMLVVPSIKELRKLNLKKLRPSVKAMASVKLDVTSKADVSYVEELQKQYRIDIRVFTNEDRYGLNVDRGVVFIGVNSKTEPFGLITENPEAIDLFMKQFIIETWTRGHPIGTHSERLVSNL